MNRPVACLPIALAAAGMVGCGASPDKDAAADGEAKSIMSELEAMKPGERLIKSSHAPRFSGPYPLNPGYVVRWEQAADGRLTVALESRRGSRQSPYQLLIDTAARAGKRRVTVRGRLHVHVLRAAGPYVLRFTPSAAG